MQLRESRLSPRRLLRFTMPLLLVWGMGYNAIPATAADSRKVAESENAGGLAKLQHLIASVPPGSWYEIPDSSIAPVLTPRSEAPDNGAVEGATAVINDWNGSAYDAAGHKWYFFGGGHHGYS